MIGSCVEENLIVMRIVLEIITKSSPKEIIMRMWMPALMAAETDVIKEWVSDTSCENIVNWTLFGV